MNDFDDRAAAAAERARRWAAEIADRAGPLDAVRSAGPAAADQPRRWIAIVAASVVVLAGVAGLVLIAGDGTSHVVTDDGTAPSDVVTSTARVTIESVPEIAESVSSTTVIDSLPDDTTASAAAASIESSTGDEPLLRPIFDPSICESISARDGGRVLNAVDPLVLFARPSEHPVAIQIIGDEAAGGPAAPFALVQRFVDRPYESAGQESIELDGSVFNVSTYANGNGEAWWDLVDGGQGYLRSRGLTRDQLVAIVAALTPRPGSSAIPGFDYTPTDGPEGLALVHEQMNTEAMILSSAASQCRMPETGVYVSVATLDGDPVAEYAAVIDRIPPAEVEMRGGTVIIISTASPDGGPTAADVVNADEDLWSDLRTRTPPDQARMEPIGGGIEVLAELEPLDGAPADGHLTFRVVESEGIPILEVHTADATIPERGVYWHVEIDGRTRLVTTVGAGGVLGQRIGDSWPPASFIVEVSIIDSDDLVLQTTGEIMLIPQS